MFDLKESIKLKIRIALAGVGCHKCEKSNEEDFSEMAASENIVNALADDILMDVQKYDKYRWHDLRKNPDDLPDEDIYPVLVLDGDRKCLAFISPIGGCMWVDYSTDNDLENVVAWKYIEPFKE